MMEWLSTWKANLQGDSVEMSTPTVLGCGGHTDHPGFSQLFRGGAQRPWRGGWRVWGRGAQTVPGVGRADIFCLQGAEPREPVGGAGRCRLERRSLGGAFGKLNGVARPLQRTSAQVPGATSWCVPEGVLKAPALAPPWLEPHL